MTARIVFSKCALSAVSFFFFLSAHFVFACDIPQADENICKRLLTDIAYESLYREDVVLFHESANMLQTCSGIFPAECESIGQEVIAASENPLNANPTGTSCGDLISYTVAETLRNEIFRCLNDVDFQSLNMNEALQRAQNRITKLRKRIRRLRQRKG